VWDVGLAYLDGYRAYEGGYLMVLKNWGKMPYPKFMENSECVIAASGQEIWRGKCFFSWRNRVKRERDGALEESLAVATVSVDLQDVLGGLGCCIIIKTYLTTSNNTQKIAVYKG